MNDTIHLKKKPIQRHNLSVHGWGISFLVETELEAYQAAYVFRDVPYGTKVEYAPNVGMWLVTVWNERAAEMGCDAPTKGTVSFTYALQKVELGARTAPKIDAELLPHLLQTIHEIALETLTEAGAKPL